MIVRAKTKRRLVILLCGVVLIVGSATAFVVYRYHQRRVQTELYRSQGIAAFAAGDFATAAETLQKYADRADKFDPDAIYKLAQACRSTGAAAPYRANLERYLELVPADIERRRELVLLLRDLRLYPEALKQADLVLAKAKDDYAMLAAKAQIQLAQQHTAEALRLALLCNDLQPLDVEMGMHTLDLAADTRVSAADKDRVFARYLKGVLQNSGDPRTLALMALAYAHLGTEFSPKQRTEAWDLAKIVDPQFIHHRDRDEKFNPSAMAQLLIWKASTADFDSHTALLLAGLLEHMNYVQDAVAIMEKARGGETDPLLRFNLVRRLWEAQRYDDVLGRLHNVELNARNIPELVLTIARADSLARLGRKPEAKAAVDAIALSPLEAHAKPWAQLLGQCLVAATPDWSKVVDASTSLLAFEKDSPAEIAYARMYLAQAYSHMGEYEQALAQLIRAAGACPTCGSLRVQLSALYADLNRPNEAVKCAQQALSLSSSTPVLVNYVLICGRYVLNDAVKQVAAEVQRRIPGEDKTLPLYVEMLCRTADADQAKKDLDQAKAAIRQSLASPTTRPSTSALAQLARISRLHHLDVEDACDQRIMADGGYGPEAALVRAGELFAEGKPDAAATFLQDARKKKAPGEDLLWRLNWATFLEAARDSRAAAAWVALADDPAAAADIAIQRSALAAPSVQTDIKFLQRTIDRIKAISGEQSVGWRMARANVLLAHPELDPDLAQLQKLLEEVLKITPDHADIHKALAAIAEKHNDPAGQIDHLKQAAKLNSSDMTIPLALAAIYQGRNDYSAAQQEIATVETFTRDYPEAMDPSQRLSFARTLQRQGRAAAAVQVLLTIPPNNRSADATMLLAELYSGTGRAADAAKAYDDLLKDPSDAALISAADFYAGAGRTDESEKLLARLRLTGATRELALAQFYSRHNDPAQAINHCKAAIAADPKNATAWMMLAAQHLSMLQIKEALQVADDAKDIPELARLRSNRALIEPLADRPEIIPLLSVLLQGAAEASQVPEILGVYVKAKNSNEPPAATLGWLSVAADRSPGFVALQWVVALECRRQGQFARSAEIALRAAMAWPANPDMARLAAESLALAENWSRAKEMALKWRDLSAAQPMSADAFLAALDLHQGNVAAAADRLRPYIDAVLTKPESYTAVLDTHLRILIRQRQVEQAAQIARPLLQKSADWRKRAMDMPVTIPDAALAAQWLQAIAPEIPPAESLNLANAWALLGIRENRAEFFQNAVQILDRIMQADDKNAPAIILRAMIDGQTGKQADAIAGYRKALLIDDKSAAALNNLACLLADASPADLAEALKLARRAVELRPFEATFHDTLATVQSKSGNLPGAIASLETAVRLDPVQPQWLIGLAEFYLQANATREAQDMLSRISPSSLSLELRARFDKLQEKLKAPPTTGRGR